MKTVSWADLKWFILIKSMSFHVYWFTCLGAAICGCWCILRFDSLSKCKTVSGADLKRFYFKVYFVHFSAVILSCQKCVIPLSSSSLVEGFSMVRRKGLSSCQIYLIGFRSGLSGGVFHQLIPLRVMKSCARWLVCLGSLSYWKRWPSGKCELMEGRRVFSKISFM